MSMLAGCALTPPAVLGSCHPSSDLPSVKQIQKIPEADTSIEALYGLLAQERKAHGTDVRDYNSLYKECVTDAASIGQK
jgi:hypothetical protein